ncbi:cyclic-di-AMP receptor [Periweissella beninensis]|uniref:Cyclic-di-AMP receptor n=1 Tax=Periweissella beninensis TaxID=504936 RepID=A0ABT0VGG9_9LACO|nr:cyclic-di-AMP receptor [Periweissella beninensis]MBM7544638.1 uncharacterized protein YaaQ [Periweissella beninensis]MCM2436919.1 cyclic-di-AMP receptor [Periweissella beninensis]MCT4396596.1 hypothetical protein [Periweissella beninensis]
MKMIMAIVQDKDSNKVSSQLAKAQVQATRFNSAGSFLRSGNTTFMIGIEDERVEEVIEIIHQASRSRKQFMTPPLNMDSIMDSGSSFPIEVEVGGGTVFVLPIDSFRHF